MASIFVCLRRLHRHTPHSDAVLDRAIDGALAEDVARVRSLDPDTTGQWRIQRARIEQHGRGQVAARQPVWRTRPRPAIAFAAVATVAAIVAGVYLFSPAREFTYATGIGQRSMVMLSDSSEVDLNFGTTVTFTQRGADGGRRVQLRGEAFFRVKKNGTPFIVETRMGRVAVMGTEFNVRARDHEMEVAVISGRVRVSGVSPDSVVVLAGGERTVFLQGEFPGPAVSLPFAEESPAWIHDKFLFQHTSVASACREIEGRFGVKITVADSVLGRRTLTGLVEGRTADSALKVLCALSGTAYTHEIDHYTVR